MTIRERPGDRRGFLHKSKFGKFIGGAVGGALGGIPLVGGIAKDLTRSIFSGPRTQGGFRPGRGQTLPVPTAIVPTTFLPTEDFKGVTPGKFPDSTFANGLPFGGGNGAGPCKPGMIPDAQGFCVAPTSPLGASRFGGDAVNGRFGPAQVPGSRITDVATCNRGMVLGKDGLCYDNLPNKNRLYPRGRRPLLTGGDMKAISRARTAGNRLANAKSDLIAIGMLKAPGPRKRRKKAPTTC